MHAPNDVTDDQDTSLGRHEPAVVAIFALALTCACLRRSVGLANFYYTPLPHNPPSIAVQSMLCVSTHLMVPVPTEASDPDSCFDAESSSICDVGADDIGKLTCSDVEIPMFSNSCRRRLSIRPRITISTLRPWPGSRYDEDVVSMLGIICG